MSLFYMIKSPFTISEGLILLQFTLHLEGSSFRLDQHLVLSGV